MACHGVARSFLLGSRLCWLPGRCMWGGCGPSIPSLGKGYRFEKSPTFCVVVMPLYRNWRNLILRVGFCMLCHIVASISKVLLYSAIVVLAHSRLSLVVCLWDSFCVAVIPWYAMDCIREASFAPWRSKWIGILRSSLSRISCLHLLWRAYRFLHSLGFLRVL